MLSPISDREREVLELIAYENTNEEIAEKLYISNNTAKTHRKNLLEKMGAKNTAGLVRRGFELGLLQVESHIQDETEPTHRATSIGIIESRPVALRRSLQEMEDKFSRPFMGRVVFVKWVKEICSVLILSFVFSNAHAQLSEGGIPVGFSLTARSAIPVKVVPTRDRQQLGEEDRLASLNNEPYRFGYHIKADYNLRNSGVWTDLNNGDRIWQLQVDCPNALAIQLLYKEFFLPPGSKLFLYTPDRSQILGAFTMRNNKENGRFATALTKGEQVIIEYYEPRSVSRQGRISIENVVHGYRDLAGMLDFEEALPCHQNINCAEGAGWENQRDAVARILVQFGDNAGWCTGTLVNNTAQDNKLYFLTANHCFEEDLDAEGVTNASQWIFYWNYESAGCVNPGAEPAHLSTTGATLRANWQDSDFGLLELTESPLDNININTYFAGWNRANNPPAGAATGIHHPAGDIKKMCIDNDPLISNATGSNVGGTIYPADHLWESDAWDFGITEGGSSGSGLFDANKRLIGQLLGGSSDCQDAGSDVYGKFSKSWTGTGVNTRRLSNWLDPGNTGVTTLDGKTPGGGVGCTADVTVPAGTTMGNTVAGNSVSTQNMVAVNGAAVFSAPNVNLNAGFEVAAGSCFEANNVGCGYNGTLLCEGGGGGAMGTCESPHILTCGQVFQGNNTGGESNWSSYQAGTFPDLTGPEKIHTLVIPGNTTRTIMLSGMNDDLDLLIATACDPVTVFDGAATIDDPETVVVQNNTANPVTYYIIVDGYDGATSIYSLSCN